MPANSPWDYASCTGDAECRSHIHVHGCFRDDGTCDHPGEHDPGEKMRRLEGFLESRGVGVTGPAGVTSTAGEIGATGPAPAYFVVTADGRWAAFRLDGRDFYARVETNGFAGRVVLTEIPDPNVCEVCGLGYQDGPHEHGKPQKPGTLSTHYAGPAARPPATRRLHEGRRLMGVHGDDIVGTIRAALAGDPDHPGVQSAQAPVQSEVRIIPNAEQYWSNRDGRLEFDCEGRDGFRAFRVTVEALPSTDAFKGEIGDGWVIDLWICPVCATEYSRRPDDDTVHGCPACGGSRIESRIERTSIVVGAVVGLAVAGLVMLGFHL